MDDADEVGLLPLIVRVQEDRVLHDIGVDLALEHGIVGFEPSRELDIADSIALLLQLRRDADLEFVDIGTRHEADFQIGFGCDLGVQGGAREGAEKQNE